MPAPGEWKGGWPTLAIGTDFQKQQTFRAIDHAKNERENIFAERYFPRGNIQWTGGVITAMTTTSLTDSSKTPTMEYVGDPPVLTNTNGTTWIPGRWFNWVVEDSPWIPKYYEVIIYSDAYDQPWRIARARIVGNTVDTLYFDFIGLDSTDIAGYIGKRYEVIKQFGIWWHERRPNWPNPPTFFESSATTVVAGVISDTRKPWNKPEWKRINWVGKRLAFKKNGRVRFGVIVSIIGNNITFTSTYTPDSSSPYAVFTTTDTAYYTFNHDSEMYKRWTGSPQDYKWSHNLDDQVWGASGVMIDQVQWEITSEDNTVTTEPRTSADQDLWSGANERVHQTPSVDTGASGADVCFTPYIHRAEFRASQIWCEQGCSRFVPDEEFTARKGIPDLVPALMFNRAAINTHSGKVTQFTDIGGTQWLTLDLGLTPPYSPANIHFAIMAADDTVAYFGELTVTGREVNFFGPDFPHIGPGHVGLSIIWSYGWTRRLPLEVMHHKPRSWFTPDINPEDIFSEPIDPPTSEFPGLWDTRAASIGYRTTDALGQVIDGQETFNNGDVARFVGDNFRDPTGSSDFSRDFPTAGKMIGYFDKGLFDGMRHDKLDLRNQITGHATGGSDFSLTDTGKTWSPFGTMRTYTGNASGGSPTTLVDNSVAADGRFAIATGRWKNFTLQITKDDVTKKVPITDYDNDGSAVTFTFPDCGISVDNTCTYRIDEPNNTVNFWQATELEITKASDGTVHTVTINQNDGDTLFFSSGTLTVVAGDQYRILAPMFGFNYQWNGTKWIRPTGWTSTRQQWGRPHVITRYGRAMKGDYDTENLVFEIQRAINTMTATRGSFTYKARGSEARYAEGQPPEPNSFGYLDDPASPGDTYPEVIPGFSNTHATPSEAMSTAESRVAGIWAARLHLSSAEGGPTEDEGTVPTEFFDQYLWDENFGETLTFPGTGVVFGLHLFRAYMYARAVRRATVNGLDCNTDFYAMPNNISEGGVTANTPSQVTESIAYDVGAGHAWFRFETKFISSQPWAWHRLVKIGTVASGSPIIRYTGRVGGVANMSDPPTVFRPKRMDVPDTDGFRSTTYGGARLDIYATVERWKPTLTYKGA